MAKDFRTDVEFNNAVSFLGNISSTSSITFRPQLIVKNTNTDAFSSYLVLAKAPSDNLISAGDDLGTVMFQGSDTTGTLRNSSYIAAKAISQGASYVASDLFFYTTSSAATTNTVMVLGGNLNTTLYGGLTASSGLTTLGTASTGNITSTGSIVASIFHSNNNGNGTNFRVGDDVWIGDINLADTISIRGISGASSNGYIRFGSDSNSFGYNGSSLTYSGSLNISGNLTASVGTTRLGSTTLTDANGINFASNSASEGGQINLLGGTSYSSSPMQIDNYQGDLRILGNNGNSEYFRIGQTGGVTIAAGTTSISPLKLTSGTLNTAPTAGAIEYDGNAFYATTNTSASSRGIIPVNIFATNTSNLALSAVNTAQSIFASVDDVVTVAANTTYKFNMFFALSAAGTSSVAYSENFLFGGTAASVTTFGYRIITQRNATAITQPGQGANIFWSSTSSANLFAATASTAQYIITSIEGIIRTTSSGTLTPQIQFTVTPQNTISASILANSYIELTPVGSSAVAGMTAWT